MQDSFYNSASRWPPPRCHYDSRQELRTTITDWGIGRPSDIPQQLLWMHGPFGVGKSAIAQSCAESLATENKLCASIFFSRPNKRNNPDRVFTSIAYQFSVKFPPIADILDREILKILPFSLLHDESNLRNSSSNLCARSIPRMLLSKDG